MVRLYWLGEILDSTPIATYTVILIQIGQLFRKISSDKLFRTPRQTDRQTDRQADRQTDRQADRQTDRQTHTHTHARARARLRQPKIQFSWRFSVSRVRKCA